MGVGKGPAFCHGPACTVSSRRVSGFGRHIGATAIVFSRRGAAVVAVDLQSVSDVRSDGGTDERAL
jgi:hypothetical protein